jgi:hypothetical protein
MAKTGKTSVVEVPGVDPLDSRFLREQETFFLILRGRGTVCKLLLSPSEVFGRNEVRFPSLFLRPTDYLGQGCLHCAERVDDLADFMLCVRAGQVVAAFHESCFKRWFVLQDKASFGGYRFGYLEAAQVRIVDGVSRVSLLGEGKALETLEFDRIEEVDYVHILDPGLHSEAAYVRKGGEGAEASGGKVGKKNPSDTNILFCPHCDHPNKVAFLETVGAHQCERCQGRYGVKIVAL